MHGVNEVTQEDIKVHAVDLIPVRATLISAIFTVPYVVNFIVFQGNCIQ